MTRLDASGVGRAALLLGAGRKKKEDKVDPGAGVEVFVKIGDEVEEGQPMARLYGGQNARRAAELVLAALKISATPIDRPPVILNG